MHRHSVFTLHQILPLLEAGRSPIPMLGHRLPVGTKRLAVFKTKGLVCAGCGAKGSYFALESHLDHTDPNTLLTPHLNLYTDEGVLMTVDHIVALADGGSKEMENLQPMCKVCNVRKGSVKGSVKGGQ